MLAIGAGGLGSSALQYLAGAGVGTLGIVDDDRVALSNLHRQLLHATEDVGRLKVDSAAEAIGRLNPHVRVEKIERRIDDANAREIVAGYDLVLDGSEISPPAMRFPTPAFTKKAAGDSGDRRVRRHADDAEALR